MELDNIKEAWQAHEVKKIPGDNDEIRRMLNKKSKSPIAKMKKNLLWEMIVIVVLYTIGILYYIVADHGRYWELALMLFLVAVLFMYYYYRKNKLLNEMECVACEVKSNLERQVSTLDKYLRLYFIAGTLLTPIAYFTTGLVVLYKTPGVGNISAKGISWFVGSGIGLTVMIYFANKWYVNKLYGQHVKKLKNLLQQMDEPSQYNSLS